MEPSFQAAVSRYLVNCGTCRGAMLSSVLVRAELEGASCWIELSVSKSSDQGTNIAGEPTATLSFDGAAPMAVLGSVSEQHLRELLHRGAAMHSAMMAGALEQALQIAVGLRA